MNPQPITAESITAATARAVAAMEQPDAPVFASEAAGYVDPMATLSEDLRDLDTTEEEEELAYAEHGLLLDEGHSEELGAYEEKVRAQVPRPSLAAAVPAGNSEAARDRMVHDLLVKDNQERERYARMAAQAAKTGRPLPPVSLSLVQRGGDPTEMLGADGSNLLADGEVGLWVSYKDLSEDLSEKDTRKHIEAVIRDGGHLVRDADGRPLRAEFGYAMALPIAASALRMARAAAGNVSSEHLDRERMLASTFQQNGFVLSDDNSVDIEDTTMNTAAHYV